MEKTVLKKDLAIAFLRYMEPPEGYYLAFSGGKDSVALYYIALESGVSFDSHYNVTTADPPELVNFIKENFKDVKFHYPKESMWKLIERKGILPTRLVRYCCDILKERGGTGRIVLFGVRAAESPKRSKRNMVEACLKDKGKTNMMPLLNWTDDDIWNYIKLNNLPYCKLYDEGFKRIGCVGCPLASRKNRLKEFERFPKYKAMYLSAIEKMLKTRAMKGLKTTWTTAEDAFEWWMKF